MNNHSSFLIPHSFVILLAALSPAVVAAETDELLTSLFHSGKERSGDLDGLCHQWLEIMRKTPGRGEQHELALERLRGLRGDLIRPFELVAPLRTLLKEDRLSPTAARVAERILDDLFRTSENHAAARKELDANRGFLVHWAVIGPLGRGLHSEMSRVFDVERELGDFDATHEGLRRRVRWRRCFPTSSAPAVEARPFLKSGSGVFYHLCQVSVKDSREVVLEVSANDALWLFVNGEPAHVDRDGTYLVDPRRIPVTLRPGWNRILVKNLGERFSVEITDRRGAPLAADRVQQETELTLHPPDADADPPPLADEAAAIAAPTVSWDQYTKRHLRDSELSEGVELALHRLAAAELALVHYRPDHAVIHAEAARIAASDDAHVQYHAARTFRRAWHLPSDHSRRGARLGFEKAVELDEDFVPARLAVAEYLAADEQAPRAAEMTRRALQLNPESVPGLRGLLSLYRNQDWETEAVRAAEGLAALAPRDPTPYRYRGELAAARSNIPLALEEYRAAWVRDRTQIDLLETISELESRRGNADAARQALETWHELAPADLAPALALASFLEERGELEAARSQLESAVELYPERTRPLRRLAELHERRGDVEEALRTYRRILAVAPGDLQITDYVRHLEGRERDRFWTDYDESLEAWIPRIPDASRYPRAESLAVLDLAVVKIYPDGSTEEFTHMAVKLLSEASKERMANVETRGELLELRTRTADGEVLEPVTATGRNSFVMPGLEQGGFVEFAYVTRNPRFRGWHFANGPFFFQDFSLRQPFLLSRYVLLIPDGFDAEIIEHAFHTGDERGLFATVKRRETKLDGGYRAITYETLDAPRLQPEFRMPDRGGYIPNVQIAERRSWVEVAGKLSGSVRSLTAVTPRLQRYASEVVVGIEGEGERARALFRAVDELIKDSRGARDANGILLEKAGRRDVLFKALLDAIGLRSSWAFVRPREGVVEEDDGRPGAEAFSQRVVLVEARDEAPTWVTTNLRLVPYGKLPYYLQGGTALVLDADAPALVPVPTQGVESMAESLDAVLVLAPEEDPLAAVAELTVVSRSFASYARKLQLRETDQHRRELYLQQVASALFPGARIQSSALPGLADAATPLTLRFELEAPQVLVREGDTALARPTVGPLQMVRSFIRSPQRQHPYKFTGHLVRRDRLVLGLGKRFRLNRLPEATVLAGPLGSYTLRYRATRDSVTVEREVQLQPGVVSVDDFSRFLEFCQSVDRAESERIVLAFR